MVSINVNRTERSGYHKYSIYPHRGGSELESARANKGRSHCASAAEKNSPRELFTCCQLMNYYSVNT